MTEDEWIRSGPRRHVHDETKLSAALVSWLAFADQKVQQIAALARGLAEGRETIRAELDAASAALADRFAAPGVRDGAVRLREAALTENLDGFDVTENGWVPS